MVVDIKEATPADAEAIQEIMQDAFHKYERDLGMTGHVKALQETVEDIRRMHPLTRRRIGLLIEGHVQYSFMTIAQVEKFYSAFYPRWKKDAYYGLMEKLHVAPRQPISRMSCGQRSQVTLGLILAQDPDLLVLDDLGSTALNDFTTDKLFEIVDERYRSGKPLIVTTNLNPDEAWKSSIGMRRIFDRLRERCRHVVVDGESRRRAC